MINLLLALTLAQDAGPDSFDRLHSLVRPVEKEAPWSDIPWMTSLWQARERAAREGSRSSSGGGRRRPSARPLLKLAPSEAVPPPNVRAATIAR
jgi:hypothetical protein